MVIAFLAIVAYFLSAGTADAGFLIAAVSAIAGALSSAGIGAVLLKGLLYVGLSLGVSLLQKALQKDAEEPDRGTDLQIKMGDDQPISFPMGNYAVGGKRKYIGVWGEDGKTPNAYVVDVVELSNLPIASLNGVWADDKKLTIDYGRPSEYGFPVNNFVKDGNDYMWIKFYNGTQTTADPYLINRFNSKPNYFIDGNFIGIGCAYAIITCRFNEDLYSGLPNFTFEVGSIPLYDIRKDSTNGGSGSHRWNNPATWEPSTNPVVGAYNIIRGIYFGDQWIYGGRNLEAFRLPSSSWIAAANACDVTETSPDGPEPAYRFGYEVRGNVAPVDAAKEILKGANATIAEVGGVFKIQVGSPGASIFSFSDDDIIVTKEQSFDPFPNIDSTLNGIEAVYPEPLEKWTSKDAPARYDDVFEAEDGGRRLTASVSFAAVPYRYQVQRVMLAMLKDYRRFRVHQVYLSPEAYALEPNDVVSWTSARNGYSDKKFIVIQAESDANFNQLLTLKEVDPSDYDWASGDELPISEGWIGPIEPDPQIVVGWQVSPAALLDADGEPRRPSIRVSCAAGLEGVTHIWIQVRLAEDGTVVFDSDQIPYDPLFEPPSGVVSWILNGTFLPATEYEVRARFVSTLNQNQEWSAWLPVLTQDIRLGEKDVYIDVDLEQIEQSLDWLRDTARSSQQAIDGLIEGALENAFASFNHTESVRQEISVSLGAASASFRQELTLVATSTTALASRIENLNAALGGNTAEINIAWAAVATEVGYGASYQLTAAVNDGTYRYAALGINVPVNPLDPTQIVMEAERFVFSNGGNFKRTPFIYQGGVLTLNVANIGTVNSGLINSLNSKMTINLNNGTIVIRS